GASYLRLNRDQLPEFELSLIPTEQIILGKAKDFTFQISAETLISVYFRAPIYLRDTYKPSISPDLQLGRSQWAAFIRSFLMFEDVLWVNHPRATYQAEVKPYQLYLANKLGFKTPKTVITNDPEQQVITKPDLIIKTLDPVILSLPQGEAFVYTNFIKRSELQTANLSGAPVILQEAVVPKVDIRVTVIGKNAYPVSKDRTTNRNRKDVLRVDA
ncbi:MAG: RimK-like protein, partial [Deltaproteobacteria bacterium]|nr:RimK-like protein [Deltaproteobacteria bacterium]